MLIFTAPAAPTDVPGPVPTDASNCWTRTTSSIWHLKTQTAKIISRKSSLSMGLGNEHISSLVTWGSLWIFSATMFSRSRWERGWRITRWRPPTSHSSTWISSPGRDSWPSSSTSWTGTRIFTMNTSRWAGVCFIDVRTDWVRSKAHPELGLWRIYQRVEAVSEQKYNSWGGGMRPVR